ncbi:hypothetical protein V501_02726 [Pseudogymnoascus sp. VKM F-4519 (FW-2642)]|nr:hypothetical protein V501_02726 [Pseudogymnoascus sp. VKM F-4519 (FW-2642)]
MALRKWSRHWVVHGYKFMIDFNFGIVDISSGMKRIENSKEAFRNLVLIADDGVSEYSSVNLTPSHYKAYFPMMTGQAPVDDAALKKAYVGAYTALDKENARTLLGSKPAATSNDAWLSKYAALAPGAPATATETEEDETVKAEVYKPEDFPVPKDGDPEVPNPITAPMTTLAKAQSDWNEASLNRNKSTVRGELKQSSDAALLWINSKIKKIESEIEELKAKLPQKGAAGLVSRGLQVINANGVTISEDDRNASPSLLVALPPVEEGKENPWTRVTCKSSTTTDVKESSSSESASAIAAKAGFGLWSVSGGAAHTKSSAKAMSSMSNLSVEIQMDCMVVEIDRPWLHADLFSDAKLDSGPFEISPGEAELKGLYNENKVPKPVHQQFSSFPSAFVITADIELSFSGDTTHLESAVEASSTSANVSVGYGPFSVSASHSQSKSSSKTKMESTATGCKISVQSPQIVAWVQTLLPALPRDPLGPSRMVGIL